MIRPILIVVVAIVKTHDNNDDNRDYNNDYNHGNNDTIDGANNKNK